MRLLGGVPLALGHAPKSTDARDLAGPTDVPWVWLLHLLLPAEAGAKGAAAQGLASEVLGAFVGIRTR